MARNGKKAQEADAGERMLPEQQELNKVRDILFGAQVRDHEERFKKLEQQLRDESALLRSDINRRFESLETSVRSELGNLAERLAKENADRSAGLDTAASRLKDAEAAIQARIAETNDHLAVAQKALTDKLADQGQKLGDEIVARHEEAGTALARAVSELRQEKADRVALARLLTDMAQELGGGAKSDSS